MTFIPGSIVKHTDGLTDFAFQQDQFSGTTTGNSTAVFLTAGQVTIALSGDATSVSAVPERSPDNVNWDPVDSAITGNLSTPASAYKTYTEGDSAWWRVALNTNSGGTVGAFVAVSGRYGSAVLRT